MEIGQVLAGLMLEAGPVMIVAIPATAAVTFFVIGWARNGFSLTKPIVVR